MRSLKLVLIVALCLLGAQNASAGRLTLSAGNRVCLDNWNERRAMRRLFPGRMQLTLGDMHRRH